MMSRHVYFLGIGGTLMGSLALLAKEMGYRISGSDNVLYPPMSDQLANADIDLYEGFDPSQLEPAPDLVVVGNAGLPRGHPGVEQVLEKGLPYTSGAEFLGREILANRWVLAVAGTHGKTTTASMLAWILDQAGLTPGFLIGGVPKNFSTSARHGDSPFFVVEADEYDASYFDRRSKFVHYRPRTLIINNLEYDHADIFPDLAAIQTQFHHLIRTVPGTGLIVAPTNDDHVHETLQMGCWTPCERFGQPPQRQPLPMDTGTCWRAESVSTGSSTSSASGDGSTFDVLLNDAIVGRVNWSQLGEHNMANALAAIAAARHVGVKPELATEFLNDFAGVLRRMDLIAEIDGISIYDDFAHHPTAIRQTLQGLRKKVGSEEIIAIIEPRSHTMSLGTLRSELTTCCAAADAAYWFRGENIKWDLTEVVQSCVVPAHQYDDLDNLVEALARLPAQRRHLVIMSNGSFGDIYHKLPNRLRAGSGGS
jgi:UDP-N-acetylmuramate: L-alanyl-gamma-D-glutamyl-meso-diaminopimelate ligase